MSTEIRPSDVIKSAADEIGHCMAIVRAKAINTAEPERSELFDAYDNLLAQLQQLVRKDLKKIDRDPAVKEVVGELLQLTQQLAKVKREMRTAKAIIDRMERVLGWIDELFALILPSKIPK